MACLEPAGIASNWGTLGIITTFPLPAGPGLQLYATSSLTFGTSSRDWWDKMWNWCIGKSWGSGRKCPLPNWASIPARCRWKMVIRKDIFLQLLCGHPENWQQNVCLYSRWCNINCKRKKHGLSLLSDCRSFLRASSPGIFTQWIQALWRYGARPCWDSFPFSLHSSSAII